MECIVLGWLIARSKYLPRPIGLLMQLAGVCYLTNSFALILDPELASRLFPAILLPPFIAESSLAMWLLLKGVEPSKWAERGVQFRSADHLRQGYGASPYRQQRRKPSSVRYPEPRVGLR